MQQKLKGLTIAFTFLIVSTWAANTNAAGRMQQLADSMLKDIHQTTWISEGKGPHVAYVFFDPNCPYCHKLYERLRPWVKQGKLEVRWIPVGILTTTSRGKAVAILGAKDPLQAFYQNENHYNRGGGIDEDLGSADIEKKLKTNENLLARTNLGAVPLMLFRKSDGEAMLITGAPPKERLAGLIKQIK